MSRVFLVWSLLFGLALVGADWWFERGHATPAAAPSYEGGTPINVPADEGQAKVMEGGTPMPPK